MSEGITYNMTKQGSKGGRAMNPRYAWIAIVCFLLIAIAMVVTAHAAQTSLFDGEG